MSWIYDEINNCRNRIYNNQNEINRLKNLIASLECFEGDVFSVRSNFGDINSSKAYFVDELVETVFHSVSNDEYSSGITSVLTDVGEQYVGGAFDSLSNKIKRQLQQYYCCVEDLIRENMRLENRIAELYEILRREEEEARRRQNAE